MRQEQDKSVKKRDRRLIALAGGIFVLAVCVFGGLYSQRKAAQGSARQRKAAQGSARQRRASQPRQPNHSRA